MKVVFTAAALADLDDILAYTAEKYPHLVSPVERRIHATVARIARSPESARRMDERPGVRTVLVLRYPFRIFYWVREGRIEILHIRHTARSVPEF